MKKERDVFVDIAKGLAMLMVVRIHTEVFGVIHAPYPIIAVPLFFFLSGFYDNTDKPLKEWLPKAFKSLFLTGLIWVFITFAFVSLLHYVNHGNIEIKFSLNKPLIGGSVTWFLFALFYAKLLSWLLHKLPIKTPIKIVLLVIVGALSSTTNMPLLLDEGLTALPFYYLGRVFYPCMKNGWKHERYCAAVGFVCMLLMLCDWFPHLMVPCSSDSIAMYPVLFVMTVFSFASVLWLSKKMTSQKWLANYGTQTLGILVLHPIMLHTCAVIFNRTLGKGSVLWIITFLCAYVIVCTACYFCSIWISKYCPILLGKYKQKK